MSAGNLLFESRVNFYPMSDCIQNDKDVAKELLVSLKEDTSKVSALAEDVPYSQQLKSGQELIANSTFESMGLKSELINGMYTMGLEKPTLIQNLAIPQIIKGKDAAFQSKSGTGKTIAFALGALQKAETGKGTQVIIMSPTRELCTQIGTVMTRLASFAQLKVCLVLGDFDKKEIPEEIVVGTPGKLISLINSSVINADSMKMIILDEADDLISNRAFIAVTLKLLERFAKCQKIFFSATYSELSQKALTKLAPTVDRFLEKNEKADKIQLYYIEVPKDQKISALKSLMSYLTIAQSIVFVATKNSADYIAKVLREDKSSVSVIHGDMSPAERDASFQDFLHARTKILISTNVFARGMDIPQVNLIINYDIPNFSASEDQQTYIHRIGRSGRFNRAGYVVDFVSNEDDLKLLGTMQSSIGSISKKFTIQALHEAFLEDC